MSRPNNKEWMNERNRLSQVYRQGAEEFIEYAIAHDVLKLSTILCPCVKCRNKLRYPAVDIRKHLIRNGINKTYTQWLLHGEDPSFISMDQHPPLGHAELEEDIEPIDNNGDEGIGIKNLVDAAYGVHDETCGDTQCGQTEVSIEPGVANNKYEEYKRLAAEKLYPSCEGPETTLSAIVELHNLKKQFGWSGNSMTVLLSVLKKWLPRGNTLPEKYPRMKSVMKDLGMKASFIQEQADPSQTCNNRTDKWLAGHEDKNGCVLESAKPFYDKVKEAKLKRKSGEVSSNTTENDELSDIFGKDERGRVRGVGSHVTKKQLFHLGIAKAKEEANKVEKEGINALKDEFKSYVQEAVKVQFQDFQLAIQGTMQNMMANFNRGSPHVMTTPRSEFASNSVHRSCNLAQNLDNVFTPSPVERPNSSDKPSVILIDRENKELAKGYVVTDAKAEICHGKKVGIGEKKVYIDEVLEPDAPLWFPQDGNDTLSAYVAGGYIIWFEPWLKYI